jgi:hypothetical protein
LISSLPCKKKKVQQALYQEEEKEYKDHTKRRIVIEHTICKIKKYKILLGAFTNRL